MNVSPWKVGSLPCLVLALCGLACGEAAPAAEPDARVEDGVDERDPDADPDADTDASLDPWQRFARAEEARWLLHHRAHPDSWRSALYPPAWTPDASDPSGAFLHDFSYAGYRHGEDPPSGWPTPVVDVTDFGADPSGMEDSTSAIQAAIDALPQGGTVALPQGRYWVAGRLWVRRSGVVLAGAGAAETYLHLGWGDGVGRGASFTFAGERRQGPLLPLLEDGESRASRVRVAGASQLRVGQDIGVGWVITRAFVEAHGMTGTWVTFNGQPRIFFRRQVVAVEGEWVTLDVPLRYAALLRDEAFVQVDEGYLSEVGLEDLAFSTVVDEDLAWAATRHHGVAFVRVADGWIRRVATFDPGEDDWHLQSNGLLVDESKRVSIADVVLGPAIHRGPGGNGYLVEVSRSSEVLIRDATARGGRHNFIQNWDFGTSGVVWLRTRSLGGRSLPSRGSGVAQTGFSEFHHSLAMANLIDDSYTDDGWQGKNRHAYSSGAGHSATESVFWNLRGPGQLWSYQFGLGYVIGTSPDLRVWTSLRAPDFTRGPAGTEPEDWSEGLGAGPDLVPQSLYEDQRRLRLLRAGLP